MITLYTFGPFFGLPDASPFVMKVMMLLKLAGLPHKEDRGGLRSAPKGKLPYIDDAGEIVADSTFIRSHIERKYGFDFDAGLTAEQKAIAWAVEKMCEEHLYFVGVDLRWCDDANFAKGPAHFFDPLPPPLRGLIRGQIRRKIRKTLYLQGCGRHSRAEIAELGIRDIDALAALLGDKPYFMGTTPTGADATVFAFLAGILMPVFDSAVRVAAEGHTNLTAYVDRLTKQYFPPEAD